MLVVILGQIVSGSVGSGMMALVSIVITDLVPIQESATWRSYVNVVANTAQSLGGPLGGWLADTIGWRWSVARYVLSASIRKINATTNESYNAGHSVSKSPC